MTTDHYPHTDEVEGIEENIVFEGDTGTLPLDARKGLVLLLKRTHVWEGTNPREWNAIVGWQGQIESRLNDMFLTLTLDHDRRIAYKEHADPSSDTFTTLLQNRSYTREEVGLLLHMREVYRRAMHEGNDSAYIDRSGLTDVLAYVRPASTKDHKRADDAIERAVERLREDRFLLSTSADTDRLRISPVIETLMTVERIDEFIGALVVEAEESDAAE